MTKQRLLHASLAPATRVSYSKHLERLDSFMLVCHSEHLWPKRPLSAYVLSNFIAFLASKCYAPSTITSNVSAISYIHKLTGWEDPADSFLIKKMLVGAKKIAGNIDTRLPITEIILNKLADTIPTAIESEYVQLALKAMFSLAFFALLRVSEFTAKDISKKNCKNIIHLSDIAFEGKCLLLTLRSFKHSTRQITLELKEQVSNICPVRTVKQYLKKRTTNPGPLFQFPDKVVMTSSFFTRQLRICLSSIGLSSNFYSSHSFRIGGATVAASRGFSESQIQAMGRWKSGAYKKYIRIPTLATS